jgi:2-keto-4-pentenoate hydratase/2-oxohepta-3-ene-1,7-dioic acid hydratase in catechol pathway
MKLAQFCPAGALSPVPGVLLGAPADRFVPFSALPWAQLGAAAPEDLIACLAWSGETRDAVLAAAKKVEAMPVTDGTLAAPLAPRKCLAIGLNYRAHAEEFGGTVAPCPTVFTKQVSCITGPFYPIHRPRVSDALDYEGELVLVIGQRCRHVPEARALEVVGAYCVGNDVSVRDWQLQTPQFTMGKSFDTHGPIGPYLTTADEVPDPQALGVKTWVNDELRQESTTALMIFPCAALIAHLSAAFTLEPGDLIFTGTPAGIGHAMKPPAYLKAGDRVRVAITGLGEIDNPVIAEPAETAFPFSA